MPRVKRKPTWVLNRKTLHEGQIVRFRDEGYRVTIVNECRARIVPLKRTQVEFVDKLNGKRVTFSSAGRPLDISPQSEIEILVRRRVA